MDIPYAKYCINACITCMLLVWNVMMEIGPHIVTTYSELLYYAPVVVKVIDPNHI